MGVEYGVAMLGRGGRGLGEGILATAYVAKIEVHYGSNLNFPSLLMGQLPVCFLLCSKNMIHTWSDHTKATEHSDIVFHR